MQAVCDRHETESVSESAHDLDDSSIIEEHPVRTQHELLSEKSFAEHSQNIEKSTTNANNENINNVPDPPHAPDRDGQDDQYHEHEEIQNHPAHDDGGETEQEQGDKSNIDFDKAGFMTTKHTDKNDQASGMWVEKLENDARGYQFCLNFLVDDCCTDVVITEIGPLQGIKPQSVPYSGVGGPINSTHRGVLI